ncbi:MAG: serine/threonine protein kinase [Gemmatimonadetes bacterium]|nr:serine/threonine protein kinase [Gemmatimonadota bacterium]
MNAHDDTVFSLLDPEFFVSIKRRKPDPEFSSVVSELLPGEQWGLYPQGVWTYVHPTGWTNPPQGWKLHLSATPENAVTILRKAVSVLRDDTAPFKFACDRMLLYLMLAKNWSREGGGKFITVYPKDDAHFHRLGRALSQATAGLEGPYILSDRRIPGSRVVFYRYGQHLPREELNARGRRAEQIVAPGGAPVSDRRRGYYHIPEWVQDPFGARPVRVVEGDAKKVTLNGRYEVEGILKYSNTGGIYRARDLQTREAVVVREARPFTGYINSTIDAVALLHKEARVLRLLDGTRWAPRYVDHFQVWEHHYLVQEQVRGALLREYALSRYFKPRKLASPRRLFWTFRHVIEQLVRAIEAFHRRGIIVRDLSANNVMVRRDGSLCLIDLEFAWERHGQQPFAPGINTPGFAPAEQVAGAEPTRADDFHALGATVVELCSMMANGLGLNRRGVLTTTEMMMDEVGLPRELLTIARGLLEPDPASRWDGEAVRRALRGIRASDVPWTPRQPGGNVVAFGTQSHTDALHAELAEVCESVCSFFELSAEPHRADCLFPASPQAHHLNPVCIQLGACGPIEYVRRLRGEVPGAWLDWVERMAEPGRCPPGLYLGQAGVALTLTACGRAEAARPLLLEAAASPLLETEFDLFHGLAGVGLAALAVSEALDDEELREVARRIGARLEGRAERRVHGIAWRTDEKKVPCGLAEGGSGVALFFTYLGACTREPRYWAVAKEALEFEFSQVAPLAGYAFWPAVGGTRRRTSRSPHVVYGSAGVGAAAARLYLCTRAPELRAWAERCAQTVTFRWTNKLWQDMGYAGWGELFLDLHAITGEARYREHAGRIAEILLPNRVTTRLGVAFPGAGLNRVASDFGMGASGIALFLHRLLTPGTHRAFFPDHLLPECAPSFPPVGDAAATPQPLIAIAAAA